jgi:tRNA-uridine 2-sulfurtransferase
LLMAGSTQSRQRQTGAAIFEGVYESFEDHLGAPRGKNRLTDSALAGTAGGAPCGDLIRIALAVRGDTISDAGFDASGCGAALAAGSATVELVTGATVLEAARLTAQDISNELGGLSAGKVHAATLAADALHTALGKAALESKHEAAGNRTLVAMSGGVDSAVAALLARERGDEVVAVTLELWSDPHGDGARSCCSPESVAGARALAHSLGLPHLTMNLSDDFKREVVDDFVAEYESGRTPNPCVRCNGIVRFDRMLEMADAIGARTLATGHYARTTAEGLLRVSAEPAKDQTYMLARLSPETIKRVWFPLGEATEKEHVREVARRARLSVADKPDSQDLCFLAGVGKERLLQSQGLERKPGDIVDEQGIVLGRHQGQEAFTVGQRRGLNVPGPEPRYVIGKSGTSVVVGPRDALRVERVELSDHRLHRDTVTHVKLRYRSTPVACRAEHIEDDLVLHLEEPFSGVAPGQTACLLDGDLIVGWGVIAGPSATVPVPLPLATTSHA